MTIMDLAFRTELYKCMLKIELTPNYPAVIPKITLFFMSSPAEGAREPRSGGEIKERVLKNDIVNFDPNMNENYIVKEILGFKQNLRQTGSSSRNFQYCLTFVIFSIYSNCILLFLQKMSSQIK